MVIGEKNIKRLFPKVIKLVRNYLMIIKINILIFGQTNNKCMKILSLFDGISCARVACDRAGIQVENYYASEIDKYAMSISQKNYPDILQIGSVTDVDVRCFMDGIDLLIGGSPCQDLSIAKKNRQGLEGSRSGLFYEYVRILNEVKPKYFILENVLNFFFLF